MNRPPRNAQLDPSTPDDRGRQRPDLAAGRRTGPATATTADVVTRSRQTHHFPWAGIPDRPHGG
jgi:hypothetical protein